MALSVKMRSRNAEWVNRAAQVLPGATLGTFQLPADEAMVIARGVGPRVWDADGNEYIDYILGSGPLVIGHAHPRVVAAVTEQVQLGSTFYGLNTKAIELAETIVRGVPCAEAVKFVSTGTEATFHAMRLARAHTGKPNVLKFGGGYHGVHDYSLMNLNQSGMPVADSAGIPQAVQSTVFVAQFNNIDQSCAMIRQNKDTLAAVIVEPLQRTIKPIPGFLEAIRAVTQECGICLIFDEVVTGFRLAYGGAQEYYGVVPDLATYGKAISGGYPLAAVAGSKEIIGLTDPALAASGRRSYIGGTLSGNPVAATAGLATLAELAQPGAHAKLFDTGQRLMNGFEELGRKHGLPLQAVGEPPVFQAFFCDTPIVYHEDSQKSDPKLSWKFGVELVRRGLFHTPGFKFYISLAHGDREINETLAAVDGALAAIK